MFCVFLHFFIKLPLGETACKIDNIARSPHYRKSTATFLRTGEFYGTINFLRAHNSASACSGTTVTNNNNYYL